MKITKKIALVLLSMAAGSFISSGMADTALPMGWYIEGNLGGSKISNVSFASGTSMNSTGLAWSVNGGYKFMPYFATEIGYTSYANGNITSNGSKVGKDQAKSYDIAGKAILPVQDSGVEIFAKLGVARAKSHVTVTNAALLAANGGGTLNTGQHNSTSLYLGLGGDYSFMPNMAANIQWNRVAGSSNSTGNLDLLSLGLTYLID